MTSRKHISKLATSVKGLAVSMAVKIHKVPSNIYDLEDVIQSALLGAVAAAHDYNDDHESEASFSTYAVPRMRQEINKLYRRSGVTYIPKRDYTAMEKSERARHMFSVVSLSNPASTDLDHANDTLENFLSAPEAPSDLFKFAVQKTVKCFLTRLPPVERDLIEKVYGFQGEPWTLVDASSYHGFSKQRGWQLVQAGMKRIEKMCKAAGVRADWLSN